MCVRSQSQPGRENQHKLLYSFHRFLSCPVLGPGISIRYTAFVCFFSSSFLKSCFSLLLVSHTHKKIPHSKELHVKEGFVHHTGLAGVC